VHAFSHSPAWMLTLGVATLAGLIPGRRKHSEDKEVQEVTEIVVKNSVIDFLAYLTGKDELDSGEEEILLEGHIPETPRDLEPRPLKGLVSEPSFSQIMASLISTDAGAESSEAEESPQRPGHSEDD